MGYGDEMELYDDESFVDLHIHSSFSDGSESVESICQRALEHGVRVISVTDHNTVAGVSQACEIGKSMGLVVIPGVEIDSLFYGKKCHILAYGIDVQNQEFVHFLEENKMVLQKTDVNTLGRIAREHTIDLNAYESFPFDPKKGGWKLIQFLVAQKAADNLDDAIKLMKQYKEKAPFPASSEIIQRIHEAGGFAVIAHPGETFHVNDAGDEETFAKLSELVRMGADGIECFYPRHKEEFEDRLFSFCEEHDLLATVGCDYHGNFFKNAKQNIGCEFKRIRDLRIKKLLEAYYGSN